jgi:hypothetical protein
MINNLKKALDEYFLNENSLNKELINSLAKILYHCSKNNTISFKEIKELNNGDITDLIFFINEKKLLIPEKTFSGTMEWEDTTFLNKSNEIYDIPNIIKQMVIEALKNGIWDSKKAIIKTFKRIGEADYKKMPSLVKKLYKYSKNYHIYGSQIKKQCDDMLLGNKVNSIISELKGTGVMSPKLTSSFFHSIEEMSPIYELNPSLFKSKK